MPEKPFQRSEFDAQIVAKALTDKDFRARLISNPRQVYQEQIGEAVPGMQIPEEVEIRVVEEQEDAFYLILPCIPDGMELSEEAIGRVARHEQTHRHPCWGLGDAPQ